MRFPSAAIITISVLGVILAKLRAEMVDYSDPVVAVGGPPPYPSEVVTVAAFVLLVSVAITFTMPVVSKARRRFESDAGDQGSDLPPERR